MAFRYCIARHNGRGGVLYFVGVGTSMIAQYIINAVLSLMGLVCLWFVLAGPLYLIGVIDRRCAFGGAPWDVFISMVLWAVVGILSVLAVIGWFVTEVLAPFVGY